MPVSENTRQIAREAEATIRLLLSDGVSARTHVLLVLSYCGSLDPMLLNAHRYDFDELDWGYTEQPMRQLSLMQPQCGMWEKKRESLLHLLRDLADRMPALRERLLLAAEKVPAAENYRAERDSFDEKISPCDDAFASVIGEEIGKEFMKAAENGSILPPVLRVTVLFAAARAILYAEGAQADAAAAEALMRELAAAWNADREAMDRRVLEDPGYSWETLANLTTGG